MIPNPSIIEFSKDEARQFESFQQLKYEIFVDELGWNLPSQGERVQEDEFDSDSWFLSAIHNGRTIGIVRGTSISSNDKLPWENLFEHHFSNLGIAKSEQCVLTSLGVAKEFRGAVFGGKTVGQMLVSRLVEIFEKEKKVICWASTKLGSNVRFFSRCGFHMVDHPFRYHSPVKFATNIAICLNDDPSVIGYLERIQSELLHNSSLNGFLVDFLDAKS